MLKTFKKGGVHPPENKISAETAIEKLPLPKLVSVPLSQHIGAPSKVLVKKKDEVKAGQLIAETSGFISANIHSPVAGTVKRITKVMTAGGYKSDAVTIQVGEEDVWEEGIDTSDAIIRKISAQPAEILEKIKQAGIVGMGGATFPSHVKLNPPKGKTAETLIINGVECEPYLTSDHRVMLEMPEELIIGTQIMMKALKIDHAYIGIENNKKDAIELLEKHTKNLNITIIPLKVKYPQGGEKQLIKAAINREVPSGALPIEVGAVVHNVGTAVAVYDAVQKNKPLVERVVTVTGKNVKKPSNFLVRIGTSTDELIEAAGGIPENTGKIISGGSMMGKALKTTDVPVTKGTSGIVLMPEEESFRRPIKPCIRCSKCITVCPMGLEPYLLMALTQNDLYERDEKEAIMDCIECGSCSYICPADRPLLDYIRLGKKRVGAMIRERNS
jgi:electron transport complex protein RnfC